ncbi:MAG: cation:proton antiporter subunit C [Pseudomonadota bacterium]
MDYLGIFNYWVFAILLMIGFYAVIAKVNLIKKLIGLSLFQSAVFLLYITMGRIEGGTAPIYKAEAYLAETITGLYANPLPQVLILTAIVVGISTLALGLGLVVRIREEYGTIEETEIAEIDQQ